MQKLSEQLLDAYMIGDTGLVSELKELIAKKNEPVRTNKNVLKINTVLNNEDAPAYIIYNFLSDRLGNDWWEWENETIDKMLWLKYGVALTDINRDKVLAIKHLCNSDRAFGDWFEFNQLALSFGGCMADFEVLRSPSPGMAINAIHTMKHIRPDADDFGKDVKKYVSIILKDSDIYFPPPSIKSVIEEEMDKMISSKTKGLKKKVYKRLGELANNKVGVIHDTAVTVQAKRLLKAEAAAHVYNKGN